MGRGGGSGERGAGEGEREEGSRGAGEFGWEGGTGHRV